MKFNIKENNYHLRCEQKKDVDGIRQVNLDAFKQIQEAKLVEEIRKSDFFVPELSIVCEKNEQEIVGHILISKIEIITKESETLSTLGLAPLSVKPQFQNLGIGSRLIEYGLELSKRMSFKHMFVLGHPKYYPRFGFAPTEPMGIKSPFPVPMEVFMGLELQKGSLKGISGVIKYPPAFDVFS
ncbi:GNAT family N-acetyltransferase [Chengkuizengella axinellae]|uniref:N-acetyltransferase n=1 Tax=Chengkuizengella axinellae TaxID=3064388 RepID=A0ABT9IVM7_9BACL|nr:N-acetyltransferase [Chengkuizengella sp. 2205SS18-9]MDP5272835.1 N-acetyltransferase [Chengkuizengella sp. 2205SS18-9]